MAMRLIFLRKIVEISRTSRRQNAAPLLVHQSLSYRNIIRFGYRLEKLAGNRNGQHSIRINDQWRICFIWRDDDANAYAVEIVDYHH
jgi:hypothetical protein